MYVFKQVYQRVINITFSHHATTTLYLLINNIPNRNHCKTQNTLNQSPVMQPQPYMTNQHQLNPIELTDDVITIIYQYCCLQSIFQLRCANRRYYNVSCQYNEVWLPQHKLLIDSVKWKQHYTSTLLRIPTSSVQYLKSLQLIGDSVHQSWMIAAQRLAKYHELQHIYIHCYCSKYGSIEIDYLPNQVVSHSISHNSNTSTHNKCVSHMLLHTLVQSHGYKLRTIDYNYCYRPVPAHLFKQFTSLYSLNLDYSDVYDSNLLHIAQIPELHYLSLQHTRITDTALVWLQSCSKLHWLNLNETCVRGNGLSNLIYCTQLHVLELRETLCDSNSINNIVMKLDQLKILNMSMTHVTIEDATKLRLIGLHDLIALNISSRQHAYDDDELCGTITKQLSNNNLLYYTCNAVHDQCITKCHNNIMQPDDSYWYSKQLLQQSIHNCSICRNL